MKAVRQMSTADYHTDADGPSLSASIASILVNKSPKHAWAAHPKLNPDYKRDDDPKYDIGTVAHAILLEGADVVYVVHAPDWRTKEAKEGREYARSVGRIPLLAHQLADVELMVSAIRMQLGFHDAKPTPFYDGTPEATLVWEDEGVRCKARLDWLHDSLSAIDDLKTTSRSAHPAAYSRNLFSFGADARAAFYLRGLEKVTGERAQFRWVVVETAPPFALSVLTPGADVLALGEAKVEKALMLWRECLETDTWPGYPAQVATVEMPPWEEARWLEREIA